MTKHIEKPFICDICGSLETGDSYRHCCLKCYHKEYYKRNKEKIIKKAYEWNKNNPEKTKEIACKSAKKRWANYTPEEKLQKSREQEKRRSKEEKERRNKRVKEWYQREKNTDKVKENRKKSKAVRRASMYNVECTLTKQEWEKIKEEYDYKCAYCGCDSEKLTQDHYIPISKGGSHTADNIVPACFPCNRKKWDRLPDETFVRKKISF